MLFFEKKAVIEGASVIIGVDEAGRGPLAGPVVACAVSLKKTFLKRPVFPRYKERIDDSKKLRPAQRQKAFSEITKRSLFATAVQSHRFIDKKNIYQATLLAMRQAVNKLITQYCLENNTNKKHLKNKICVLVDGNACPNLPYKTIPIIKGDSKSLSIAAASIIAKVARDNMMLRYDKKYAVYGFSKHKGYGTKKHIEAIKTHGPCPIHRKTFAPVSFMVAKIRRKHR